MKQPKSSNASADYRTASLVNNSDRAWQPINRKLAVGLIAVILVESYLSPLIAVVSAGNPARYMSLYYLHATIGYSLIVLGIVAFGNSGLQVFHDHFSAWTIVLSCFATAILSTAGVLSKIILAILAILLGAYILGHLKRFRFPTSKSVMAGILWAGGTVVAIAALGLLLHPMRSTLPTMLGRYIFDQFVVETSLVTVIEESYFRGLIYGLLILVGVREDKALLLQAGLFFGGHYLIIGSDPLRFFVLIPVYTIVASLATKKYRMLYVPIMIHTATNVLSGILSTILWAVF